MNGRLTITILLLLLIKTYFPIKNACYTSKWQSFFQFFKHILWYVHLFDLTSIYKNYNAYYLCLGLNGTCMPNENDCTKAKVSGLMIDRNFKTILSASALHWSSPKVASKQKVKKWAAFLQTCAKCFTVVSRVRSPFITARANCVYLGKPKCSYVNEGTFLQRPPPVGNCTTKDCFNCTNFLCLMRTLNIMVSIAN